jgi:hypothetical protein
VSQVSTDPKVKYVGRAWRSRFLRAPARADVLAARADFVALGEIADLALGLKTGNDDWFVVSIPDGIESKALRAGARKTVAVEGLSWEGVLSTGDLRAVLMSPHELQKRGVGRQLIVPKKTTRAYVYPADRPRREGLQHYVDAGERANVHKSKLVQNNGQPGRWDRQRRELVNGPWALPYNSAYDYGAHDNAVRRVLNGRFVGVQPHAGIDSDLLGAALNSTFVMLTRLLEGVSTGSEAAYDVGPPAARLMKVPDPRKFTDPGKAKVVKALAALRKENVIPPGPSRAGKVVDLRRRLDLAILEALGLSTGDATVEVEDTYLAYGRWRGAVEDVEARMQEHRRALSSSGRTRSESPVEIVGRQVWDEISVKAPRLPADALSPDAELEPVSVARDFKAPDDEPMFDGGFVKTPNGSTIDLGDYQRARYAGILLMLGFSSPLLIPTDPDTARRVCEAYIKAARTLDKLALRSAKEAIGAQQGREAADIAMRMWRHSCHDAGMRGSGLADGATNGSAP